MNSDDMVCTACNGSGEYGATHYCLRCRGTGSRQCDMCLSAPAVDAIERGRWELGEDDASRWVADPRAPGIALCERCLTDASHAPRTVVPPAPATIPCLVQCDDEAMEQLDAGVANDTLAGLIAQSVEVAEDAKAGGVPAHEAYRLVRRSAARRIGQ